jgi:hypothetical protein
VHDALTHIELVVVLDAELAGVLGERLDLRRALGILVRQRAVRGRHVVVDDREGLLRRAHLAARHAQALEGLRARHLMDEVTVDIQKAGAVRLRIDDVVVPDLVVEGARLGHLLRPALEKGSVRCLAGAGLRERRRIGRARAPHGGGGAPDRPPGCAVRIAKARP